MRDAMLIVHFLGLAMGLGTSFAFMFLGIKQSKLDKEERRKLALNTSILGTMGHIGLTMLIISGLYLMTPFWQTLHARPLLIIKLVLVLVLSITIVFSSIYSQRARKGGSASNLRKLAVLGKVSLLTAISIVFLAVLIFH